MFKPKTEKENPYIQLCLRRISVKILVIFDSKTGNTEKMAVALAKGAENEGAKVTVKRAEDVKLQDFTDSDGIITGSPTYFG